jgi:branched-chain amino acid transport system ATP-binding protein
MARTFQAGELFDDLTVRDNLLVAAERPRWWSALRDMVPARRQSALPKHLDHVVDLLEIREHLDVFPTELPHGRRALVGVARALASEPALVLLDEPGAGLHTSESRELGRRLRSLVSSGLSLLLIDHDMGLVLNTCDYLYVLKFGEVLAEGTPAEIRSSPEVIAAYLGSGSARDIVSGASTIASGEAPR